MTEVWDIRDDECGRRSGAPSVASRQLPQRGELVPIALGRVLWLDERLGQGDVVVAVDEGLGLEHSLEEGQVVL